MSSLIALTTEDQVLVATDTLATRVDGSPLNFTTKALALPHLRMIMAGLGVAGLLERWFVQVNSRFAVRGIDHLNFHAPAELQGIWQSFANELSIPDSYTTSVFHLGLSEGSGKASVYAYNSSDHFKSRRVPTGVFGKPFISPDDVQLPKDAKALMESQRELQEKERPSERVHIGGEIMIHHLTASGFSIYSHGKFDDFDRTQALIYTRSS